MWDVSLCALQNVFHLSKHPFEGDLVAQGHFFFFFLTSIATTHLYVAHICIILINVSTGLPSLAFGPGSGCSRQQKKNPLLGWLEGKGLWHTMAASVPPELPLPPENFMPFGLPLYRFSCLKFSHSLGQCHWCTWCKERAVFSERQQG